MFVCAQADHILFLGVGPRQVLHTSCDHQAIQWMCVLLLKGFQYLHICKILDGRTDPIWKHFTITLKGVMIQPFWDCIWD